MLSPQSQCGKSFSICLTLSMNAFAAGECVAAAFGDETVVQTQPGQFDRQQHTIAIVNLALELEWQRGAKPLTSKNDLSCRAEVPMRF